MGSLSIRSMNHTTGTRDLEQSIPQHYVDLLERVNEFRQTFGGDALRELFATKNNDWQATCVACRDIMAGGALDLMTISMTQNGGK